MANKFLISRERLATFIKDNDTLRRFEQLFQQASITTPADIEFIFELIQDLTVNIGIADQKGNYAADLLAGLAHDVQLLVGAPQPDLGRIEFTARLAEAASEYIGTVYAKTNQLNDSLTALARTIDLATTRPELVMPRSFPVDYIDFDQTPSHVDQVARVAWNSADDTLNIHHSGDVAQQVGLETYARITNNTGTTIPNGSAIGFDPITDSFFLFIADGTLPPITIIGVATQDIPNGSQGRITVWGRVRDLDTTGTPFGEVWTAGDILYVSTTVAGGFTIVKPTAPNVSMPIAQVRVVSSTVGEIFIRPTIEQQLFYGQFSKTTDQTPSAANTADAVTWSSALIASGISIGTPASRIVAANAGLYNFSASFQLTSGSASVKNVWLWYRKNGTDIANSALITSMDSGTAVRAPSRSLLISLAAGDYVEVMWASDDTNVTLDAIAATAFAPAAPAALLTVAQEQQ